MPGHDEEIQQITATGAAEVGVAEAHDRGVGDVIAGAPIPLVIKRVGAQLNCAEGSARARKAVAVTASANAGVNQLKQVRLRLGVNAGDKDAAAQAAPAVWIKDLREITQHLGCVGHFVKTTAHADLSVYPGGDAALGRNAKLTCSPLDTNNLSFVDYIQSEASKRLRGLRFQTRQPWLSDA